MAKEIVSKKKEPMVPGFGVAGNVICPFMSLMHSAPCAKQGCELWVELTFGEEKVARCSLAWLSVLSTETRQAIDKLRIQVPKQDKENNDEENKDKK